MAVCFSAESPPSAAVEEPCLPCSYARLHNVLFVTFNMFVTAEYLRFWDVVHTNMHLPLPLSSVGSLKLESLPAMLGCCASEHHLPPLLGRFFLESSSVFWDVCTSEDTRVHHHGLVFWFEGLSVFSDVGTYEDTALL